MGGVEAVLVKREKVPDLRRSLKQGGGVRAAFDVGHFMEGFTLLYGGDLDLVNFGVIGLEPGDDIDRPLRGVVQDALAELADDSVDARLLARPVWVRKKTKV